MKFKISILPAVLLFALGTVTLQAQKGQGKPINSAQRAEKQTAMMIEKLALTPEQAARVKEINLKYTEKLAELKGQTKGERAKDKNAFQQLHQDRLAELNKVLNKDQQAKLEKMQAEMKQQRGKGRKAGFHADPEQKAGNMTRRMTEKLSLTPEQATQVKAINLDFAKKQQALRTEKPAGEKPGKAAMQGLRNNHQSALKKVLTKEQYSQWEQLNKEQKQDRKGKMKGRDKSM